jgi:ATP-dependent DNA helicase RecG
VDEQHKFGVAQREQFVSSGDNPDVLVMTATPIPRTLTLTLYGDLDVSVIDELPANRGEIVTALRNPNHMKRIISFMKSELEAGRQIYIVAPLIEESDTREQAAAVSELEKWRGIFPQETIGLLHGRLSPEEKDEVMSAFRANDTHILVATTVVEVGVDVPNATIMIINDADAFGLSQLHQLRGRIGRGQHKSYCILLSTAKPGEPGREKLDVLCRTINGFEIAEEDFRLRGPGDVLGTAQSGLGAVQFTEWLSDMRLIHRASRDAAAILQRDPELQLPQHAPLRALVAPEAEQGVTA